MKQPTNLTFLRMAQFPICFSVFVLTRGPWPLGSTNCGNASRNNLINHTHMQASDHFVKLAQTFWDRAIFVCPRFVATWLVLLANELAECTEARMWESSVFNECANSNLLVASDGSGGRDTPQSLRHVAFGVAIVSLRSPSGTSFELQHIGFLGGQV